MVGWFGCFGCNSSLRQYFSFFRVVLQWEGERKRVDSREKNIQTTQPPSAPTAAHLAPVPLLSELVWPPGTESYPALLPDHILVQAVKEALQTETSLLLKNCQSSDNFDIWMANQGIHISGLAPTLSSNAHNSIQEPKQKKIAIL